MGPANSPARSIPSVWEGEYRENIKPDKNADHKKHLQDFDSKGDGDQFFHGTKSR